jgi:tRNA pseudouridine55 synthase
MEYLINVYKKVGLTPFQLIQEFKKKYRTYKKIPLSHAGKLDPLAQGVMLLVAGNEIKNIKKYMSLDKTYKARILFGFSTDSYDIQGIPLKNNPIINLELLKKEIDSIKGEYKQTLPVFSGRIIDGKPLFYWARTNQLNKIKIPEEIIKIYNIQLEKISEISSKQLNKEIKEKINLLHGDFRQEKIIETWDKIFNNINEKYPVIDLTISCSSGTYIRSIANDLGKRLNSGAILLGLTRTKIDNFSIDNSIVL